MFIELDYDEPLFRPPSEAYSFILQATIGCSHNGCTFCEMYKTKKFRTRSLEEIEADIKKMSSVNKSLEKVFIADGDPFVLSADKLARVCELINKYFDGRPRISTYASPQNILAKTDAELKKVRDAGISLLYYGLESGSDLVLKKVNKGASAKEQEQAIKRAGRAGFDISLTWILGLGGRKYSKEHATATARLLNNAPAQYVSALTLMLPAGDSRIKKTFPEWEELTPIEALQELKVFVEEYKVNDTIFRSNHASNYLSIKGRLPQDGVKILKAIDKAIASPEDFIRPDWARGL